jgi:hypothetical protein
MAGLADVAQPLTPPLSLRDFFQRIFPTIIAVSLFAPLYAPLRNVISLEGLIFSAFLLGYLIESPISRIISLIYDKLPSAKAYSKRMRWFGKNWDYSKLFYSLTNEEREYLYLTASYAHFYKSVSFYLLVYFGCNLFLLLKRVPLAGSVADLPSCLISTTTPILKEWEAPTFLLLITSAILCYSTFKDYLLEYEVLFLDEGAYVTMAEKYHRENGNIARNIWGRVLHNGQAVDAAKVSLLKNAEEIADVTANEDGYFQFDGKFAECVGSPCKLKVRVNGQELETSFSLKDKQVPYFQINVP